MLTITITFADGTTRTCGPETRVGDLLRARTAENGLPYIAALVNNEVCSLSAPLQVNSTVEYLTLEDPHGESVYRRSLAFLAAKAARDLYPGCGFTVEHSIGNGYYCSFASGRNGNACEARAGALEKHMRELVRRDMPFSRSKAGYVQACKTLEESGQTDKLNLLRFRNPPRVEVYACDNFMDLGFGVLAPSTAMLEHFKLLPYAKGLVLQFPEWKKGRLDFPPFPKQPHLQRIFEEHKNWGRAMNLTCIADLNLAVAEKRLGSMIHLCEVLHEKKLGLIADQITTLPERPKFVLIAGPSSSGKTTFAKRLEIHLRVNGLKSVRLEVDNYFKSRAQTPRDANGEYDFEHIEAVDIPMFSEHLKALEAGEEVEIPTFNFRDGLREFRGNRLRLSEGEIVILEGIHCLNPRLTAAVPGEHKFKIYISALTQLTLDNHNRISTTDLRLMRRMIRDNRTRGHSALRTLELWSRVRKGEQRWIFPFQSQADATFNSALAYEPAVLRTFARPLLSEVKPSSPEYADAMRLLSFLEVTNPGPADQVPPTSLLREFIGGSAFD